MSNPDPGLPAEVVLVAHADAGLQMLDGRVGTALVPTAPLNQTLDDLAVTLAPLFGATQDRLRADTAGVPGAPDLSVFYSVAVPPGADLDTVAGRLAGLDGVAGAYVKAPPAPGTTAAVVPAAAPASGTPDLTARQTYLDAAPAGIGARSAWTVPGGDGAGVDVVVLGAAWQDQHEDLDAGAVGLVAGVEAEGVSLRNHGTALLGIVRATRNAIGVTGIAPTCHARQVSVVGQGTAAAITAAAAALPPGGILLLGLTRPGPGATGLGTDGQIPLEWWPDDLAAVRTAVAKGVVVVGPAGDGAVDLDDPRYAQPLPGFPDGWANPFARGAADSGSVVVGAGSPPDPTHGRSQAVDRSRLPFSNHGSCVDAQGWGAEITTLGSGDLQGGPDETRWYTDVAGGTAAAAAMVAGAAAALQGATTAGASKRPPLTPGELRDLLRSTGSPQQDSPTSPATQRIGPRPDLLALIARLAPTAGEAKDTKDSADTKQSKESKDHADVKPAKEHKHEGSKETKDVSGAFEKGHGPPEKHALPLEKTPIKDAHDVVVSAGLPAYWPVEDPRPVRHFIGQELRPDLGAAALRHEPDLDPGQS